MIIQHNLTAQSASRFLGITSNSKAKTSERLASGYKINRAADDAAGLSISEKMRWQIRGLNKASTNAQDGISMAQTADGALEEVDAILQRINELSVQAANDTNTDTDRAAIQAEITQLQSEIDRISDTTTFNTIPLLKIDSLVKVGNGQSGDVSLSTRYNVTTTGGMSHSVYGTTIDFSSVNSKNIGDIIGKEFTATCTQNCDQVFNFKFTDAAASSTRISSTSSNASLYVEIGLGNPDISTGTDIVNEIMSAVASVQTEEPYSTYSSAYGDSFIGHANGIASDAATLYLYSINDSPPYSRGMGLLKTDQLVDTEANILLQVGAKEGETMGYNIKTINSSSIGINNLDVSTNENAGEAITTVQNALTIVNSYRSYLGAIHNRLEHTIKNLDNTSENTQAAESILRDADMSEEMVEFSKLNILEQAGQAMLSQANSSTQGILSLLQ